MKKIIINTIIIILIVYCYRSWFSPHILSSGDWIYYTKDAISDITPLVSWDWRHNGMGGSEMHQMWLETYFSTTVQLARFIPWQVYERLFWFFPFLIIGFVSSFYAQKVFLIGKNHYFLTPLIYLTNTYVLLMTGGGQMGIALAYACFPFLIAYLWKSVVSISQSKTFFTRELLTRSTIGALLFSLITMFDLRIAFISGLVIIMILVFFSLVVKPIKLLHFVLFFLFIGIAVVVVHSYWIMPLLLNKINVVDDLHSIYTDVSVLSFFSFAQLEHAFGLLHPNWPENIFGKVPFMNGLFLFLPILAFLPLLDAKSVKIEYRNMVFLFFVSFFGVFLSKGVNHPLGEIYSWAFNTIPGFFMFRDPTKFYILTAFSYSLLIPYGISVLSEIFEKKRLSRFTIKPQTLFLSIFILLWTVLIYPALSSQLRGTFTHHQLPKEYEELNAFLSKQSDFFRVLWVPSVQRYGMFASQHPSVDSKQLFDISSEKKLLPVIKRSLEEKKLQDDAVKYIIIPYDSQGEIFLDDREYAEQLYQETVSTLATFPSIKKVREFGKIIVYEVHEPKKHFWIQENERSVHAQKIDATHYVVRLENVTSGQTLVFSERFSKYWQATVPSDRNPIQARKYNENLISFELPRDGTYEMNIIYKPQQDVRTWLVVSILVFVGLIGFTVVQWLKLMRRDRITV